MRNEWIGKKIDQREKVFLSKAKVWKKFETNNKLVALNVLFSLIILPKNYTHINMNNVSLVWSMSQSKTTRHIRIVGRKKNYEEEFDESPTKRFESTYQFCDRDINKFRLMLWKAVYPYEYMDSSARSFDASLLSKKEFWSNLTIKYITNTDYKQAKRLLKDL